MIAATSNPGGTTQVSRQCRKTVATSAELLRLERQRLETIRSYMDDADESTSPTAQSGAAAGGATSRAQETAVLLGDGQRRVREAELEHDLALIDLKISVAARARDKARDKAWRKGRMRAQESARTMDREKVHDDARHDTAAPTFTSTSTSMST